MKKYSFYSSDCDQNRAANLGVAASPDPPKDVEVALYLPSFPARISSTSVNLNKEMLEV